MVDLFCREFISEFERFKDEVKIERAGQLRVLEHQGPALGRPRVDTLKGSRHRNMKELRFSADHGVWRVAFAFDPMRRALILVAGDKTGVSEKLFYDRLIKRADARFDKHLSKGKVR